MEILLQNGYLEFKEDGNYKFPIEWNEKKCERTIDNPKKMENFIKIG